MPFFPTIQSLTYRSARTAAAILATVTVLAPCAASVNAAATPHMAQADQPPAMFLTAGEAPAEPAPDQQDGEAQDGVNVQPPMFLTPEDMNDDAPAMFLIAPDG